MALDSDSYYLAGSQEAEDALHAIFKPLVGAGPHADQTLHQLNQRFDGTGEAPANVFPTPQ
jgi:hypothetical protein